MIFLTFHCRVVQFNAKLVKLRNSISHMTLVTVYVGVGVLLLENTEPGGASGVQKGPGFTLLVKHSCGNKDELGKYAFECSHNNKCDSIMYISGVKGSLRAELDNSWSTS